MNDTLSVESKSLDFTPNQAKSAQDERAFGKIEDAFYLSSLVERVFQIRKEV
jgi:hypothetical protein